MGKDKGRWAILNARRELKKMGHRDMRRHYIVLVALMLIMIIFGTEYNYVLTQLTSAGPTINNLKSIAAGTYDGKSEALAAEGGLSLLSADDVINGIMVGKLLQRQEILKRLKERFAADEASKRQLVSQTRGQLVKVINAVLSGDLYVKLAQTIFLITESRSATAVIFTVLSFLLYAAVFCFIKNVYSAMIRRPFLEARIYRRVSPLHALHLFSIRGYLPAVKTLALRYLFQFLWNLTVVGGIIKSMAYFAVPYIVAENAEIGAREAITLSREMMDGHKLELFLYRLSFLPWYLLAFVSCGFSDLFYGAAYRMSAEAEFYVRLREAAKADGVVGAEKLDDRCLYETADRIELAEAYFDTVDELTLLHEEKLSVPPIVKRLSRWFGIWVGSLSLKRKYDKREGRKYAVGALRSAMEGESYPLRLNPRYHLKTGQRGLHINFLRSYSIWTLALFFLSFSVLGWVWEVSLHFMQTGEFANRGMLYGPWLPIYGTGGVVVLLLCSRFRKNPALEFFVAMGLCGVIEYFSGWYLETKYHVRWWSYDGYFLNLHGRICAEGLLVFGVACCLIVYLIAPLFDFLLSKVRPGILIAASTVLMALFAADVISSVSKPNIAKGAVEDDSASQAEPAPQGIQSEGPGPEGADIQSGKALLTWAYIPSGENVPAGTAALTALHRQKDSGGTVK